jgi:hypothetical protein
MLWLNRPRVDLLKRPPALPPIPRPSLVVAVPDNRGSEVRDAFRGDQHPLLFGHTLLEVTAHWTPVGKRQDEPARQVPGMTEDVLNALYRDAKPATKTRVYTEHDFGGLLPEKADKVGQVWALDAKSVTNFLKQFHPGVSLHLVAKGRLAGPDGAYAVLRAMTASYLDIVCRIHAEFNVTPKEGPKYPVSFALVPGASPDLPVTVWYTPAFFSGRIIVNRKTGTVDFFQLAIPTDRTLNAHLTVALPRYTDKHDIVRVDRMELVGGDPKVKEAAAGEGAMDLSRANDTLAREFYKFKDIDWVPLAEASKIARSQKKPIMAVITWGALDDQSC